MFRSLQVLTRFATTGPFMMTLVAFVILSIVTLEAQAGRRCDRRSECQVRYGGCCGSQPPGDQYQRMPATIQSCPQCPNGQCVGDACTDVCVVQVTATVKDQRGRAVAAMLARHNEIRRQRGLREVVLDEQLSKECQAHCETQARAGRGCFHKANPGPNEVVSWSQVAGYDHVNWLAVLPPHIGHEKRMLDPSITRAGYGIASNATGEYVTIMSR